MEVDGGTRLGGSRAAVAILDLDEMVAKRQLRFTRRWPGVRIDEGTRVS
jgi:hypothetical protein